MEKFFQRDADRRIIRIHLHDVCHHIPPFLGDRIHVGCVLAVGIAVAFLNGKAVGEAFAILKHTPKVGSEVIEKVLRSAVANAEHNYDMNVDNLIVSSCFIDQGPTMKRIHPRSRGQAFKILKRSSHVTVAVKEK